MTDVLVASIRENTTDSLNYNEDLDQYTFNYNYNGANLKFIFNEEYIFCKTPNMESMNIKLSKKNISLLTLNDLTKIIDTLNVNKKDEQLDYLYLFHQNEKKTKFKYNKSELYKNFYALRTNSKNDLKLDSKSIFNMIVNDVNNYNEDFSHNNYIEFQDNNPYKLVLHLKYDFEVCIMFELHFSTYPLSPPKVSILSPSFDICLINSFTKLDIFKQVNWNRFITLSWLSNEIYINMKEHFEKCIIKDSNYTEMDKNIMRLINYIDVKSNDIKINISHLNFSQSTTSTWKSGTGYGSNSDASHFDIQKYLNQQETNNNNIIEILNNIVKLEKNSKYIDSILLPYMKESLIGTTLIDFNKNTKLYSSIIETIKYLEYQTQFQSSRINDMYEEIMSLMENDEILSNLDENVKNLYTLYIETFKPVEVVSYEPPADTNDEYLQIVKKELFNYYDFDKMNHLYKKFKDCNLSKKTMMRVITELSSLKKNIPINWDSSVMLRMNKKHTNMITFMISGPKDTPYHNGLFEFHAYFPDTYPQIVPKVLLNTTDGGKVRFNPNLYACGKVCLSLLGTWGGGQGEGWNSELSTFLQVIVSIQSLIFVEQPYFNEPGYERDMHTPRGKQASFNYNDERRYQTLRVAIVNQIKNPPHSYENIVKEHFRMKKDEIYQTVEQWINESKTYKKYMKKEYDELKKLLN